MLLDVGDVVGDEVVAESVALVGGTPELAGGGIDGFADAVANAPGVDFDEFAFGRELEHIGAMEFLRVRVEVVDVGERADRGEELSAVEREAKIAGPVASAAELAAARQVGKLFHGAGGREIAVVIREAHDCIGVADVNVFGIGAEWIEGDAERLVEIGGKDGDLLRLAIGIDAAKDFDFAALTFGKEQIAIGGEANEARVIEIGGVELDFETLGRNGPGVGGARNHLGSVIDRLLGHGLGQVGDGEMAARAGGFVSRVSECGLAGENGRLGGGVRCGRRRPQRR